jgi:hypothetical protein
MVARAVGALLVVLALAGGALAANYQGKFQFINLDQETVTVRVGGKDVTYRVASDANLYDSGGREIRGGLRGAKRVYREGDEISLTTEKRAGRELVVHIKATR